MNKTTVFSKTGKGLLEIKNKSNRLSKDQFRVLNLVDGKATLDDLVEKSRITEVELRKVLTALSEGGFIKEFSNPTSSGDYTSVTIPPVPPSTSYVDDLDFTQILGPAKPAKPGFYQSAQTEQKQREESARKASEAAATKAREEAEKRAKEEAERRARDEEVARRIREEAERKAKEEQVRREKLEAEMRFKLEEPKRLKEEAERKVREKLEAEKRAKEEAERKVREETERRAKIQAEAAARVEAERKRLQEEERKRREDEERRHKEEEERKRREEEERKRKEEEERKRREEEERKRKEEEERKRREEEERLRQEEERKRQEEEERRRKEEEERKRKEEAERLRRELEERHRREEEELQRRLAGGPEWEEEQRLKREEEERKQREEDERRRDEENRRREEEERRREDERRRREEEERKQREEERRQREEEERRYLAELEGKRKEEEERKRREAREKASADAFPSLDITVAAPPTISTNLASDMEALRRAEAEVEKEFMAKEEAIRDALEEQERRFRLEEEARTAMDRAEREAREKADREARELADAAERARREAEQRAREDGIRRQQEDKEKRAKEQEERKKKSEEERKKRERASREQEQRAREEALLQKRKEQEELDRKKSERERLAREARKIAWGPGRIALVAVVVLVALVIGGIQIAPLSAYAPQIEKLASDAIGEPVRIGGAHASVFPGFHLKLENVTIGAQQDVHVPSVTAYMDFGSVFSDQKTIKSLEIDQLQATQEVLARLPRWLAGDATKGRSMKVQRVVFRSAKLDVKGATLPSFDARVFLADDGAITRATVETGGGHFEADILPKGSEADVTVHAKGLTLPMGPGLELTEAQAKGVVSGNQLRLSEMDLYLYGGQGKGQAVVTWGSGWSFEGDFELKRIELEAGMKALKIEIVSDGTLDAKGHYALQSNSLDTLFDNPRVEANFNVQKGSLSGFDFVRALQSPSRDGTQGGKTKFDELTGSLSVNGSRYAYNNMRLSAGLLNASASGELLPNKDVNGHAYVELKSSSNIVKGSFKITGNLKAIVLRP